MPRGGRRSGAPGKAYSNRSDLTQAPRAAGGQEYGKAGAQIEAQKAMPLSQMAPPPSIPVTPIGAESQNPNEPITAGLPIGAGPGPSAGSSVDPLEVLAELYRMDPNDDLLHLIRVQERLNAPAPGKAMGAPFDRFGRDMARPTVPMPGIGAGRMVEPPHPGGEDSPIPGHMAPRRPDLEDGTSTA